MSADELLLFDLDGWLSDFDAWLCELDALLSEIDFGWLLCSDF